MYFQNMNEWSFNLIQITKQEAKFVREKVRGANIRKTRHKYYMVESRAAMRYLNMLRGITLPKRKKRTSYI